MKSLLCTRTMHKAKVSAAHAVVSCSGHRPASPDKFLLLNCLLPPAPPSQPIILLQEWQHFSHRAAAGTEHGESQFQLAGLCPDNQVSCCQPHRSLASQRPCLQAQSSPSCHTTGCTTQQASARLIRRISLLCTSSWRSVTAVQPCCPHHACHRCTPRAPWGCTLAAVA